MSEKKPVYHFDPNGYSGITATGGDNLAGIDYTDHVPGGPVEREPLFVPSGAAMTQASLLSELASLRNEITAQNELIKAMQTKLELAKTLAENAHRMLEELREHPGERRYRVVGDPPKMKVATQPKPVDGNTSELRIAMEKATLNRHIAGNSRAKWNLKHQIYRADQQAAETLIKHALQVQGIDPEHDIFQYVAGEFQPIEVTFIRYYTGRAQALDDDNDRPAWKGYRDGLCRALGIDDNPKVFKGSYQQVRTSDRTALEIVVRLNRA